MGYNGGTITNCYATGDVSATSTSDSNYYAKTYAGGLVGSNMKTITNCYAKGNVSATSTSTPDSDYYAIVNAGGLVGNGDVNSSYRYQYQAFKVIVNGSTSNKPTNKEGTATDLATLQSVSFHTDTLGWSTDDWAFVEGSFPTFKGAGTTATIYEK